MLPHLHSQPLQDSLVLNPLDVIDSETDEQVHDDDGLKGKIAAFCRVFPFVLIT